jgi:hypothetical protein
MMRALITRSFLVVSAGFIVVSCGGSTFESDGSGGSSGKGGSGAGGSGTGGSGAGGSGTGGSGTGGSAGSSSGGSSAGGSSGSGGQGGMPALCSLPAEGGNCNAYMPSYFHNAATGLCEPFVYGGCGGNDNRFNTLAECQAKCHGGSPDMDACGEPADCVLTAAGCCAECDPVQARAFVALNRQFMQDYEAAKGCGDVQCGACPGMPEIERTSQYFVPTCDAGQCTVVDIRETSVTECADDSDCALRDGADCCEGCDGTGIVGVNPNGGLGELVCGNGPIACPGCEPMIPPELVTHCEAGRCVVRQFL